MFLFIGLLFKKDKSILIFLIFCTPSHIIIFLLFPSSFWMSLPKVLDALHCLILEFRILWISLIYENKNKEKKSMKMKVGDGHFWPREGQREQARNWWIWVECKEGMGTFLTFYNHFYLKKITIKKLDRCWGRF